MANNRKILAWHTNIKTIDEECNNKHPLAFMTKGLGTNPNILSHGESMAVIDKVNFKNKIKNPWMNKWKSALAIIYINS